MPYQMAVGAEQAKKPDFRVFGAPSPGAYKLAVHLVAKNAQTNDQ
jgi:hypothetical protein